MGNFWCNWVIPEKIHTSPMEEISIFKEGEGEEKCLKMSEGEGRRDSASLSKRLHFVKSYCS